LPVCDRIENCDYENSPALHELSDGNKLILTKCRRTDNELYNLCLKENINKLSKKDFTNNTSNLNLCFTNKKRIEINNIKMLEAIEINRNGYRYKTAELKKYKFDGNSQDITVVAGMPIIARKTTATLDILNNETFKINKVESMTITIENFEGTKTQIKKEDFTRLFHLAYCLTVHKSQGETYSNNYTIYEWFKFSDRMKYVALSRATNKKYINII
jgi:ATP-dependent exoDNAse (exonuclease V) alpha subunit